LEIAAPWASNEQPEINLEPANLARYFWQQFFVSAVVERCEEFP